MNLQPTIQAATERIVERSRPGRKRHLARDGGPLAKLAAMEEVV